MVMLIEVPSIVKEEKYNNQGGAPQMVSNAFPYDTKLVGGNATMIVSRAKVIGTCIGEGLWPHCGNFFNSKDNFD